MAVLLNQASNLRLRLDLVRRLSDGVLTPASLEVAAAVERYAHAQPGGRAEHGFEPLVALPRLPLLDLDLIDFLQALEALLEQLDAAPGPGAGSQQQGVPAGEGEPRSAALEPSTERSLALRIAAGPGAALVEVGLDLHALLEALGGERSGPGHDLALFRFFANPRALAGFAAGLIAEFARFPTDPSKVARGEAV